MSGSGSSVFGVFGSKGLAQRAFDRLRNEEGVQAFLVHVLNLDPSEKPYIANRSELGVPMQVTEVRVFPVDEDKLKAYVTITLDHCFVIRDLKIIHGSTGYFVSMPSKKRKDGTYKDIAHPINNETRRMIEEKIIAEYHKVLAEGGSPKALDDM